MPVYNAANTLDKCLESIVEQDYSDFMVVLVENGSTDESYEICRKWAKADKRIFVTQSDAGVSKARNKGLEIVSDKVDYFAFMDSDDYIDKTMYRRLISQAMATDADIVFCNFIKVIGNGYSEEKIITPEYKKKL